jgi:dipeptidyl aminopeptidase/acylaminoacyl peptidase
MTARVLILLCLSACAQAASPFTIDQVLSSPFPSDLTASPIGGKVAWALDAKGARNLWVAAPPEYRGRQLTNHSEDDGLEISDVRWTPDGATLVYVRGQGVNSRGEFPNPRSIPAGVSQTVWTVSAEGGAPRILAEGSAPAISHDGKTVLFVAKGEVWSVPVTGESKAAALIHARGTAQSLSFSPDGNQLAFVSNRRNHNLISVYDFASKSLRFLDASADRDLAPVWSPDGKQLAFIRIPAETREFMFGPVRTAQPWSIRVADVATGKAHEIWKAQEGAGSAFHDMVAENQLLWADGDRLIFPWERDGWLHLYATRVRDGGATLLTPGEFEVEHVSLTPDRKHVAYSSNQNDIDRRHIWKVSVSGGSPSAATKGTGCEWSPVTTSDGKLAYLRSDAQKPARAALDDRDLAPDAMPADFPAAQMVTPQQVIFPAADGMQIHAQLFLPPSAASGKHPAVIFFHGGSRRQMLLGWHYMFYYHQAYGFNQYLASKGYVVLSVNYRSGIGYGLDFREAKDYGATGASEYNDVMGAGLYMRTRADVDSKRIGLWGGSYGGYLTALGLARASDLFAAGVDLHGVHEWNQAVQNFVPGYDPQKQLDVARLAFTSSPMNYVDGWRSPVLLIHGDDDRNVNFVQTVMLVEALRKRHVEFQQLIFPDEIHDFLLHRHWMEAFHAADEFLGAHLTH